MGRLIETKNEMLKNLSKQKGQGLTEFVLILAFCAVIGWIASEVGFMDAIGAVFDSGKRPETVTAAIGGGKGSVTPTPTPTPDPDPDPNPDPNPNPNPDVTYNEFDWGKIDPHLYYEKAYKDEHASRDGGSSFIDFTQEEARRDRLITDQQALANLASHFIGLTQKQVREMLKGDNLTLDMGIDNNRHSVVLGHLVASGQINENGNKQGVKLRNDGDGKLKAEYVNEIFKWMKNPSDPDSVTYDDTYMYMVSDYVVSQGWTDSGGANQGCGIHLQLEYDYSELFDTYNSLDEVKVVGAHIAIDPGSQKNAKRIASTGQSSSGLDVQVRKTIDGPNQVIFYDTGSEFDENGNFVPKKVIKKDGTIGTVTDNISSGLQTWYGDSYRSLVVKCLQDFWVIETLPGGTVERSFTQGDIIKIGGSFYVVTKTGTQTIETGKNQEYLEAHGPLVKITGNPSGNFTHVNELKAFKSDTYFQYRGFPVALSNGDVYIYVGQKDRSYKITSDYVATATENGEPLFIKVGNTIEQVMVNVPPPD